MQEIDTKSVIYDEFSLEDFVFSLIPWDRVFFYGDLGAGKSTFIRYILRKELASPDLIVRSPTYTYYEKYQQENPKANIYHFDLYRIEDYSGFVSIWGEEIAEDERSIMLIEWPEKVEGYITPTKVVRMELRESDGARIIAIEG